MSRNFNIDTNAAKEASSGGKRITEAGSYVGKFRAAFYEQNEKGTESVNFMFVADNGQEAGPLTLYTHNSSGEELPSYKTFNAILACMKQRTAEAKPAKVKLWDYDSKSEVEKTKDSYAALIGPKVGLLLQGEEYQKRDGEIKVRMVIAAPFDPSTRMLADEILNKATEPKGLDRYLAYIGNTPVKKLRGAKPSTNGASGGGNGSGGSKPVDDFDDSIPF